MSRVTLGTVLSVLDQRELRFRFLNRPTFDKFPIPNCSIINSKALPRAMSDDSVPKEFQPIERIGCALPYFGRTLFILHFKQAI